MNDSYIIMIISLGANAIMLFMGAIIGFFAKRLYELITTAIKDLQLDSKEMRESISAIDKRLGRMEKR